MSTEQLPFDVSFRDLTREPMTDQEFADFAREVFTEMKTTMRPSLIEACARVATRWTLRTVTVTPRGS